VLGASEAALERELTGGAPGGDGSAHTAPATLTPRVREVALLVAEGLKDTEIAERLTISPRTVNRHVAAALRATGARNRVELTVLMRTPFGQHADRDVRRNA
jgi:DNA-binding NarL/FixJ family response regulator